MAIKPATETDMTIQTLIQKMNNREVLSIEGTQIAQSMGFNVFKRGCTGRVGSGKWCYAKAA
jgi:hypothetical protein